MSAEKPSSSTGSKQELRPDEALALLRDVRNLMKFHENMGVETYPKTEALQSFLNAAQPVRTEAALSLKKSRSHLKTPEAPQSPEPSHPGTGERRIILEDIRKEISSCRRCPLSEERLGIIAGVGPLNAELMIIGDWSMQQNTSFSEETLFGSEEDVMLWKMMEAIGLGVNTVYVSNVLKCCPNNGQRIEESWTTACFSYLQKEIEAVRPGAVLLMGELAAAKVLQKSDTLFRLRGRFHDLRSLAPEGIGALVTYHPRFLLQHQEMKKAAWQDLQFLARHLKNPQRTVRR